VRVVLPAVTPATSELFDVEDDAGELCSEPAPSPLTQPPAAARAHSASAAIVS
jgi:hypothetical protein